MADHPRPRGREALGAAFWSASPAVTASAGTATAARRRATPCIGRRSSARCALRSLVAWALRLSEGMQKNAGAVRITRGASSAHCGQSCGSSHSAIGRMSVNGPQSSQRYS